MRGIDVSSWQGTINWPVVAQSGVSFAFHKATEGRGFVDPNLSQNWLLMQQEGIVRGVYHYARPSLNDPEVEAAHFLATMDRVGGFVEGDLAALDLEDTDVPAKQDLTDWVLRWMRKVELGAGCRPFLYSGYWYLNPHIQDIHALNDYPLWIALYSNTTTWPPGATIWQYSGKGSVNGINGLCDLDQFSGTLDELRALGKSNFDRAGTWQTAIDVVNGWSTQLEQAHKELTSVREMLERLRH